jgi:hypothetical protein
MIWTVWIFFVAQEFEWETVCLGELPEKKLSFVVLVPLQSVESQEIVTQVPVWVTNIVDELVKNENVLAVDEGVLIVHIVLKLQISWDLEMELGSSFSHTDTMADKVTIALLDVVILALEVNNVDV